MNDEIRREIVEALEMPTSGLRRWFAQCLAFCVEHGGVRRYGPLMALLQHYVPYVTKEER